MGNCLLLELHIRILTDDEGWRGEGGTLMLGAATMRDIVPPAFPGSVGLHSGQFKLSNK